jgi:hypothetical protein
MDNLGPKFSTDFKKETSIKFEKIVTNIVRKLLFYGCGKIIWHAKYNASRTIRDMLFNICKINKKSDSPPLCFSGELLSVSKKQLVVVLNTNHQAICTPIQLIY